MNDQTSASMREALDLTRAGRLNEATAVIQRALGGAPAAPTTQHDGGLWQKLKGVVSRLKPGHVPTPSREPETEGGQFLSASFTGPAGTRSYRLYVPSTARGQPLPLVVMLHGCTQSPEDFATGTRMNRLAERQGCYVAYPAQDRQANPQGCWNWFDPNHQRRDLGEPSLLAGIVRQVMANHAVDPHRVFVAGLSAGGAAAAVMAVAYPDLFAAVGVHSGLAYGSARDVVSALAAMKKGDAGDATTKLQVPLIVFQGDADKTVNPRNVDRLLAQAGTSAMTGKVEQGAATGGHTFTRTLYTDPNGVERVESWQVHGEGHAWSGGDPAGTYTDPKGPDASAEMLRFFLAHGRR
ncbi:MAG: PHB depolymerase family esterase [Geminicoccaceae bacterium]